MTSTKEDIVNEIAIATRDNRLQWVAEWDDDAQPPIYRYCYEDLHIESSINETLVNHAAVAIGDCHLSLRKAIEQSIMGLEVEQDIVEAIKLLPPTANEVWACFPKKWKDIETATGTISDVWMTRNLYPLITFAEEDEDHVLDAADVAEIRHLEKITLSYKGEMVAVMRRDSVLPSIWKWNTFGKPQIMADIRETIKKHG